MMQAVQSSATGESERQRRVGHAYLADNEVFGGVHTAAEGLGPVAGKQSHQLQPLFGSCLHTFTQDTALKKMRS